MPEPVTGARAAMLGRVRDIVGAAREAAVVEAEWAALPRAYRVDTGLPDGDTLDLLVERLQDYDAQVYRVRVHEIAATVQDIAASLALAEVLVPAGWEASWLPDDSGGAQDPTLRAEKRAKDGAHSSVAGPSATVQTHDEAATFGTVAGALVFVEDRGFAPPELDRFTAVLTASTLAIAETGTIVLQNVPGQGRRAATLVPDVHLCVVREQDVVHTVPEAMRRLQATADLPTTFVSGPSATADIEMTRIKGLHGPRFLQVLLVG